jgi:phage tail-like protein
MERFGFLSAFHFKVEFLGLNGKTVDTRFQSVAGLSVGIETDSLSEGGENRFQHQLPTRTSYGDLTLKRGLTDSSDLFNWFAKAAETLEIHPLNVNITLLNDQHQPAMIWKLIHAWPKKSSIGDFNAEASAIAIQTLELGYQTYRMEKP